MGEHFQRLTAIVISMAFFLGTIGPDAAVCRAAENPWFRIVDGKPVYTRVYTSGISPNYGQIGKDEHGQLAFPMTDWNYRMIALEKK
jgi:hypothetical protein